MTQPASRSLAEERTLLARLRTVLVLLVVSALVSRLAARGHSLATFACAAVAIVGLVAAVRLRRAPITAGQAALLTGSCVVLALVAAVTMNS